MENVVFRPYRYEDLQACLDIFDANCPKFFASNELQEYTKFLEEKSEGYEVCVVNGQVRGAFGLLGDGKNEKTLNWILLDPRVQGLGVGSMIMERVSRIGRMSGARVVKIAASHKSAPFFARFGATTVSYSKNGWGPGMDRVDMELPL